MIKITADSTCDLPKKFIEENDIDIIPLIVSLGEEDFLDDGVMVTEDKIFNFVAEKNILPKTAARSIDVYTEFFKKYTDKGDEVVYIALSDGISSSYRNAFIASQEIGDDKVSVIDSKSLCAGISLLVMEAVKLAKEGKTKKEIVDAIEKLVSKVNTSFIVEKLDYLYKGGRCTKFSFSIGSMLKIKPRLHMVDGKIVNTNKEIGPMKSVIKKYIDTEIEKYPPQENKTCYFYHTKGDMDLYMSMVNYIKSLGIFNLVVEGYAGSVITSHCGPGTYGFFYITK